jgi:hypothetical protein
MMCGVKQPLGTTAAHGTWGRSCAQAREQQPSHAHAPVRSAVASLTALNASTMMASRKLSSTRNTMIM